MIDSTEKPPLDYTFEMTEDCMLLSLAFLFFRVLNSLSFESPPSPLSIVTRSLYYFLKKFFPRHVSIGATLERSQLLEYFLRFNMTCW